MESDEDTAADVSEAGAPAGAPVDGHGPESDGAAVEAPAAEEPDVAPDPDEAEPVGAGTGLPRPSGTDRGSQRGGDPHDVAGRGVAVGDRGAGQVRAAAGEPRRGTVRPHQADGKTSA